MADGIMMRTRGGVLKKKKGTQCFLGLASCFADGASQRMKSLDTELDVVLSP